MISPNFESDCTKARLYYYDYLNRRTGRRIPEKAFEHINRCCFCQDEISRLDSLLDNAGKDVEQKWRNSSITAILGLHFTYVGKSVSCSITKPFLPSLVVSGLEINIQTPIITHVNNCRDCAVDLAKIKALALNRGQLLRLSRILTAGTQVDTVGCTQAHSAISSVVTMNFSQTDAETLRHLCICPDCRAFLYQKREELRKELLHGGISESEFPCESVTSSDIFFYCLPFGIGPADDEYAEFRKPLTSHLRSCPACLAKIQQLHSCISEIAERPESGVVTCFTFDESVENESGDAFAAENSDELIDTNTPAVSSPRLLKLRQYVRPTLAAAAVLLIAFALFFSAPSAKAVSLEQIYQAVEKATNVCISRFRAGEDKPWQKQWMSQTLNVILFDNDGQYILLDYNNGQRKTKTSLENAVQLESLSSDIIAKGKESLRSSFGLLPFSDVSQAEKEAKWNRVDNKDISISPGTEVYDLIWSSTTVKGTTIIFNWRVYVNPITNLPIRTELYQKTKSEKFVLTSIEEATYPTSNEIKALIETAFK